MRQHVLRHGAGAVLVALVLGLLHVLSGGALDRHLFDAAAAGAHSASTEGVVALAISRGQLHAVPDWVVALPWLGVQAALLVLVGALPVLSAAAGAGLALGLAGVLLALQWGAMQAASVALPLTLPAAVLALGWLAQVVLARAGPVPRAEAALSPAEVESERMMGLALMGQGQLDMAFERLRRARGLPQVQGDLLNLAHEFEQKHRYDQAVAVYEHLLRHDRQHAEARKRRKRARHLAEIAAQASKPQELPPDSVAHPAALGRYQIEKELGRGAMGVVYQGRDPKIGRVVAIKALALGQEFDGAALVDARARFFREAESAGRLQHQNLVTIYDAGQDQGLAWIAMELLKGQDLSGATQPGKLLPVGRVVSIAAQVADALDYAHQQNVVHRDIKPANIMYDPRTDAVKVSDFGIARITDSSKTRTGLVLGTPSFMAPEQLAGQRVDGRCDLYALGVTLFQLLSGQLPLRGSSMSELMHHIAHTPAPDLRTLRPELPAALAQVVEQALRKSPRDRFQTGKQLAAALRGVHATLTGAGAAVAVPTGQPLVYDALSNPPEHNMSDFQETVMDAAAPRTPAAGQGKAAS
ncbi:MAG: protein kinase domain-containing protein [Giesbergeria sp.]